MLIKGAALIKGSGLVKDRDIKIDGTRIAAIGRDIRPDRGEEVLECRGKLAIPGLINCHTHLAMTLLRGYADDMDLKPWLETKIWPLEARLTPEDIRWGVKLGCAEQIRFGITCYSDMYFYPDTTAQATKEMGMRAFVAGVALDYRPDLLNDMEPFIRRWKGDELITPTAALHSAYACSKETILKTKEIADRHGTMISIHVSETREEVEESFKSRGISPVEYLDSLEVLGPRLAAIHCVWLSEDDCNLLATRKANVVDCTVSNLKLTSGIAPLDSLLRADANVCLGTDGAASNNNLSLFEEMKVTSIVQKNACRCPAAFPAEQIWHIATDNAYRTMGLDMGLHKGALADLALIDLRKPWFCPETNMISHLVYSMTGGVDTTIVNGKVLMHSGVIPGEKEILENAQKRFERLTEGI